MYKQLTSEQRYAIFALLQAKRPRKEIAAIVGISESTLSRELRRNATAKGHYFPWEAHRKAMDRRGRTVTNRRLDPLLVAQIKRWIIESDWSPEQICGVLKSLSASVTRRLASIGRSGQYLRIAKTKHRETGRGSS